MRGRLPKPSAVKRLLTGNMPNANEPKGERLSPDMPPPKHLELDRAEKKVWGRIVPLLANTGIGTTMDIDAIADYCRDMVQAALLRKDIRANGVSVSIVNARGNPSSVRNHSAVCLVEVLARLSRFRSEFGLNPSARSRVKVAANIDDAENFLFGEVAA